MAFCISIDRLDANIEEVTVGEWLVSEGDPVSVGQPVVEIITDKITFEYESEAEGVLRKVVAPAKSVVPVHYTIGVIAAPDEELPDYEASNRLLLERVRAGGDVHEAARRLMEGMPTLPRPASKVRATPAARRRARELGVDLGRVAEGLDGPVQVEDVERFAGEG
ncbi:MAG: E3 binding domain-containing protein [Armatimonadetes bacterium]|jgi:pyruvate dehydrogenase E2 component (dihydrolipoamide acetyltransferase)|nr:E3 binding domain-containing protein [Armatimonadota bacterium]MDI9603208.1 E3 binding domain-containing protein [Acidobacteriota bacterium]NLN89108.1 hypothetical protein [candidate division WS1 bacterium]